MIKFSKRSSPKQTWQSNRFGQIFENGRDLKIEEPFDICHQTSSTSSSLGEEEAENEEARLHIEQAEEQLEQIKNDVNKVLGEISRYGEVVSSRCQSSSSSSSTVPVYLAERELTLNLYSPVAESEFESELHTVRRREISLTEKLIKTERIWYLPTLDLNSIVRCLVNKPIGVKKHIFITFSYTRRFYLCPRTLLIKYSVFVFE